MKAGNGGTKEYKSFTICRDEEKKSSGLYHTNFVLSIYFAELELVTPTLLITNYIVGYIFYRKSNNNSS